MEYWHLRLLKNWWIAPFLKIHHSTIPVFQSREVGRGDFSRPKGPASLGLYPKFRGVEALTKGLNRPNVFIV